MVLKALRRVVFERDQRKKLRLYLLDYNTCDLFYGSLNVTEGLSKFVFKGKKVCFSHQSKEETSQGNNHAFSQPLEEKFTVNQVTGMIFGPHSVSFRQYMKLTLFNQDVQNKRFDQWRYISILTQLKSFDFILEDLDAALDFIVILSEAMASTCDYELDKITSKIDAIVAQRENDTKFKQIRTLQKQKEAIT